MKRKKAGSLSVRIYEDTAKMGAAAAAFTAEKLTMAINQHGVANLVLATGASQFSFLEAFRKIDLDWLSINTFHLDEYIGISPDHKASFRKYLHERIIDLVKPRNAYFLQGDAPDIREEIERYEQLLNNHPVDVACIGIGENGHIAFNDPPVADFEDPKLVKIVELDEASRRQQVGEGWFESIEDVPKQALSFTIPAIMRCHTISCVVPEQRKAEAVKKTLNESISTSCPATILRTHPDCVLFLDANSAAKLD